MDNEPKTDSNTESSSPGMQSKEIQGVYGILIEHTASAVLYIRDKTVDYANPAACHFTQQDSGDLIGISLYDLFHPEDRDQIDAMCTKLSSGADVKSMLDLRLLQKGGTWLWVECNPSLVPEEDPPAIVLSMTDISQRKEVDRQREKLQAFLHAALAQSPAGIMIVDYPDLIIRSANKAAIRLRGHDVDEDPVGQPVHDYASRCRFLLPDGRQHSDDSYPLFRAMQTGQSIQNEEVIIEQPDGKQNWVLAHAEAVRDEAGNVIAGIIITTDITERKESEQAVRSLLGELQQVKTELEKQNFDLQQAEERINRSLMRYTDLYEHAPVGYLTISERATVLRANQTACEILGSDYDSLMRRSLLQQVVSRHMTTLADHFQSVIQNQRPASCEVELKQVDKERKFVRFESAPRDTPEGDRQIRAALIDISQRMRAEIKLAQSEQRYRMIVENPLSVVMVVDEKFCITFASQGFCQILKSPYRNVIGTDFRDYLTDTQRETIAERYKARRRGEDVPKQYEIDVVATDGTISTILASIFLATGPDGNPQTVVNAVDITDRKQAQAEINQMQARFQRLFEQSVDAVYVRTAKGFVLVSPSFTHLFGYSHDELIAEDFDEMKLIAPPDRDHVLKRIRAIARGEDADNILDFTGLHSSGKTLSLQLTSSIIDWEGKPAVLGFIRDVTMQHRLVRRVQQMQRLDSIGRVAGGIAHDFERMIETIAGQVDRTRAKLKPDDILQQDLDAIQATTQSAVDLTHQLFDLSREGHHEPKQMELNDLLTYLEKTLLRVVGSEIKLKLDLAEERTAIDADPNQMEQMIINLLIQSRDSIENGHGSITLRTRVVNPAVDPVDATFELDDQDYVCFEVEDTGVGMSDDALAHVFEPFYQKPEDSRGSGLGMASVYSHIKQNNGNVHVQSTPGKGSVYTVYIPAMEVNASAE
ncbi:PAS domain S-box protein [bacterium]|nr:PAS domain S-box protein [bacterium]